MAFINNAMLPPGSMGQGGGGLMLPGGGGIDYGMGGGGYQPGGSSVNVRGGINYMPGEIGSGPLFTGTTLSETLGGLANNPAYRQAKLQLSNQEPLNTAAWTAYNQQQQNLPQEQAAAMDQYRNMGLQNQMAAASGMGQQLAQTGAGTLGTAAGGFGVGSQALQDIAGGRGPQFSSGMAQDYQNFMNPSLQSAQQSLANQAGMAWNKGVAGLGGAGGGFMNSGRMSALGQAQENAATNLAAQQQQLAFQAAQNAAQAGQQAGGMGYQGGLQAAQALGAQGINAAQLTDALQKAQLLPGGVQEAAGAKYQDQLQNELNTQYRNQMAQYNAPFSSLKNLQAGLGVLGSGYNAPNITPTNNLQTIMQMMGYGGKNADLGKALQDLYGLGKDFFKGGGGLDLANAAVGGSFGSFDEMEAINNAINAGNALDVADSVGSSGFDSIGNFIGGGAQDFADFIF